MRKNSSYKSNYSLILLYISKRDMTESSESKFLLYNLDGSSLMSYKSYFDFSRMSIKLSSLRFFVEWVKIFSTDLIFIEFSTLRINDFLEGCTNWLKKITTTVVIFVKNTDYSVGSLILFWRSFISLIDSFFEIYKYFLVAKL